MENQRGEGPNREKRGESSTTVARKGEEERGRPVLGGREAGW